MDRIPQKTLRNDIGAVLRRAESGEELTITVAGRPVAQLGPIRPRQWVARDATGAIWATPAPQSLTRDLETSPGALTDPFAA